MTNKIFVDTSGWANFLVSSEPFHLQTKNLMMQWQSQKRVVVTSNYVIAELVALLSSPLNVSKPLQIKIIEQMKATSWFEIVHITPELDAQTWELVKSRPDKNWSLVDCSSFVIMQKEKISQSLTSDHHFEQAGFIRLLEH